MTENSTATAQLPEAASIKAKIADLQVQLAAVAPGYQKLLHDIHRILNADEALVHLLSDEEIGIICRGLQMHTAIVINEEVVKKSTKRKGTISADDL